MRSETTVSALFFFLKKKIFKCSYGHLVTCGWGFRSDIAATTCCTDPILQEFDFAMVAVNG